MSSTTTKAKKTTSPATTKPASKPPKPEPAHWFAGLSETAKEKIRWVPVTELTEHPACNSLPFYATVLALIKDSVQQNGILFPLAVAADGRVIYGRYRLRAAKLLGLKLVPVIDIDITGDSVVHWLFHVKLDREHLGEDERLVVAHEYHLYLSKGLKKDRAKKMTAARLGKATTTRHSPEPKRDSLKEAAEKRNVPVRKLNAINKLFKQRPELYAQVKSGEIKADSAIKQQGKNVEKARVTAALATHVRPEDVTDGQMENRIHEGEAQDVLKKIADDTASLVLFSPPYFGADVSYDPPLPQMTYQQYLDQLCIVVAESLRISRSGGRMMIVVDTTHNPVPGGDDALPIAADLTTIARKCGWKYWMDFAWIKPEVSGSKTTFGSLASCSAPGFGRDHEWILLFFKDDKKLDGDRALSDLTREEHQEWWHTTWDIRPETRRDILAAHPVPFPEPLVERAIKMLTYRRDLVIDPYNGSGTTAAVAKRLERRFLGVDRSSNYCASARKRLAEIQSHATLDTTTQTPQSPVGLEREAA